jgi:hypothetical protein
MPTQIIVMFDNFNIQTWKQCLATFKKNTWFTGEKNMQNKHTKNKKIERKKYEKNQNIYESRIFVE